MLAKKVGAADTPESLVGRVNATFRRRLLHKRKNALFTGHDLGVENWATFATLIETCKLGGINPQAYLTDVLARTVLRGDADPIDDLLPYDWIDSRAAASAVIDQSA